MKQHDLTLASTRVHVLGLCPKKALCLRSMFHLLRRLPSCDLNTSSSSYYDQVWTIKLLLIPFDKHSMNSQRAPDNLLTNSR
ncbi:hypothetical protein BHE74_00004350 [Ensete ventricosum]|nr:hypothetical protein BHE74_00004350 [Ensete ventricosum]